MVEISIFIADIFNAIRQEPNLQAIVAFTAMFYVLFLSVGVHYFLWAYYPRLYIIRDLGFPICMTLTFLPAIAINFCYKYLDSLELLFH